MPGERAARAVELTSNVRRRQARGSDIVGGCDLVQCHLWVIWREARRWRNPTASGAMSTVQQRHDTVILRPGHHADLRAIRQRQESVVLRPGHVSIVGAAAAAAR